MRFKQVGDEVCIWLTAADTYNWATRPNAAWPGSTCRSERVFIRVAANGDIVAFDINGKSDHECGADESRAITDDMLVIFRARKAKKKRTPAS
jgi:hypothetical protein